MATSSASSSRYRRRILARQRFTADSQDLKEAEPEPDQSGETSSASEGSSGSYYLMLDYNNEEQITTPPPIAGPPSDASYDDSFIEMVKQTVQRARMAYGISPIPKHDDDDQEESISHYLNSQSSLLLSSQGSNQSNHDDEAHVEQGRRSMHSHHNDTIPPYYVKEGSSEKWIDSQVSLPEFAVIKSNPSTVNDVEYVTNKMPEKEQTEKEANAVVASHLYFTRECDLYNEAINELTRWEQEEACKDYSSWLCFDNETELAQFKDIMYDEASDSKDKVAADEDALPQVTDNAGDHDAIIRLFSSVHSISQPCSPQRSPSSRDASPSHQIEQNQVSVISSHGEQSNQEKDSPSLGSFKDKIIMQSTPEHQRQCRYGLCVDQTQPIGQKRDSSHKNKRISKKKRHEDTDVVFGSNQQIEERRVALFDIVKEPKPIPPRQPFFNLRQ